MVQPVVTCTIGVGSTFSIYGQVGKIPCKLKVDFVSKCAYDNLTYITSQVQDFVRSAFPQAYLSDEFGSLDFSDLNLVLLANDLIKRCEVTSCCLTLNDVQTVTACKHQPLH